MCLASDGKAYSWGDQYKGQLGTLPVGTDWGHDIKEMQATPVKVILPEEVTVKKVVAGGIH